MNFPEILTSEEIDACRNEILRQISEPASTRLEAKLNLFRKANLSALKIMDQYIADGRPGFPGNIIYYNAVLCGIRSANNILPIPEKVFRLDGKIDRRRYRRFVSGHKKTKKIYLNTAGQKPSRSVAHLDVITAAMKAPP